MLRSEIERETIHEGNAILFINTIGWCTRDFPLRSDYNRLKPLFQDRRYDFTPTQYVPVVSLAISLFSAGVARKVF